ncbi:helix-turn-helix domain-containing protein [Paenibacillus cremeus]|uniref:Helix-turn-helix domain-containing protein n=1 Tax=Paenibacillus cremeus TaxID=2163881 RepID=A0A559KEX1_9BACL|nr:helix-turn-helix domain-containing protein [Paenibacillus cremeus]TVY10671.1 helix-turn-helix domain-containing protein [Paenibacillus cremeus]
MSQYNLLIEMGLGSEINEKFKSIPDQTMLSPSAIAKMLNVHKETVRRWCREGKLPAYNWGGKYVICASDFKKFMELSKNLGPAQKQVINI